MKITKSKLLEMIKEELEVLERKGKRFKDVDSWFKSFFGFKSNDAKVYIKRLEDQIKYMENTPVEEVKYHLGFDQTEANDDVYRIGDTQSSEFVDYDTQTALRRLPDGDQRKEAMALLKRHRAVFRDFRDRVYEYNDAQGERRKAEEKREEERRRKEYEAKKRARAADAAREAARFERKPSKFDQSYAGKEWYRGQRSIGADYEDMSDLFERIIREELAKKINKHNKEN